MVTEIRDLLEAHKGEIQQAGTGLLARNREMVTKSLVGLAVGLATTSPTLGALGSEVVAKLFANTANRRLEKALSEAATEEERLSFIRDISEPIEALLGEFLVQLVRVQHSVKDELIAALGGGPEIADFREQVATGLGEISVQVERMDVLEGGLGVEVSSSGRKAFVREISVRGRGSVGVKI